MHDDLKNIIDEKSVKKEGSLILKGLLLLLPFCIAIIIYIYNDPFKELRLYDNYDYSTIFQNEGAASWHKYKLYCNKVHYDSFILGNSCTMAYRGEEWKKYINGSPFRLFGNDESIVDVYYKLKALDKQKGQKINNLLLVIDKSIFKYGTLRNSFMHILPPEVSGLSELRYQVSFIQGFFMPKFIIPYIDYLEFHHYRNNTMKGVINPVAYAHYGTMNNALNPKERLIILEKEKYWQTPEWKHLLSDGRSFKYSPRCIYSLQRDYLLKIKAICNKHHTNMKVVISPTYRKVCMNPSDIKVLMNVFGKDNVFNFSGNNYITRDYHNFYEGSHYRPIAGQKILRYIYLHKIN